MNEYSSPSKVGRTFLSPPPLQFHSILPFRINIHRISPRFHIHFNSFHSPDFSRLLVLLPDPSLVTSLLSQSLCLPLQSVLPLILSSFRSVAEIQIKNGGRIKHTHNDPKGEKGGNQNKGRGTKKSLGHCYTFLCSSPFVITFPSFGSFVRSFFLSQERKLLSLLYILSFVKNHKIKSNSLPSF